MSQVHLVPDRPAAPSRSSSSSSRIPEALQQVFLASNRGIEINTPPPQQAANKVFLRRFLGRSVSESTGAIRRKNDSSMIVRLLRRPNNMRDDNYRPGSSPHVPMQEIGVETLLHDEDGEVVEDAINNSAMDPKQIAVMPTATKSTTAAKKKKSSNVPSLSPEYYLDGMMRSRGHGITKYASLESAYHNKPTPLQIASYGVYMVDLVKRRDADGLEAALAAGLSPNPCNAHGESLLHLICRRGDMRLLSVMLEAGCDVQVTDSYGRTPLHEACAAEKPKFQLVETLLKKDVRLLYMTDGRGGTPLSYVCKEHWAQWLKFLETKKEDFWPRGGGDPSPPALTLQAPNTRPMPPPGEPLPLSHARKVASGIMTPHEARLLHCDGYQNTRGDGDSICGGSDSEDESECSESTCEDLSWNADERQQVLESLTIANRQPLLWSH